MVILIFVSALALFANANANTVADEQTDAVAVARGIKDCPACMAAIASGNINQNKAADRNIVNWIMDDKSKGEAPALGNSEAVREGQKSGGG